MNLIEQAGLLLVKDLRIEHAWIRMRDCALDLVELLERKRFRFKDEGQVDLLIFFWDPMEAQPHDSDVKALVRLAVAWNIPTASNRSTADFLLTSPLMQESYAAQLPDYNQYLKRNLK